MNPLIPEKEYKYEIMNRGYNDQAGLFYRNCGLNQMRLRSKSPNFLSSYFPEPMYENPKQENYILESLDRKTKEKSGIHRLKVNTDNRDYLGNEMVLPKNEVAL